MFFSAGPELAVEAAGVRGGAGHQHPAEQAQGRAVLHGRQPAAHQLRGQRAGGPLGGALRRHVHPLRVPHAGANPPSK
eukprot:999552-Prorocentrum_minimum.AAC.1